MRNERETSETRETPVYDEETADATPEIAPATLTPSSPNTRIARVAKAKTKAAEGDAKPKARKARPSVDAKPRPARKAPKAPGTRAALASPTSESVESPEAQSVPAMKVSAEKTIESMEAATHEEVPRKAELDDEGHGFFNAAPGGDDYARQAMHPSIAPTEHDVAEVPAIAPHVRVRRAKLAKYVRVAVALSAALCLAAVVRGAVARVSHEREAMASTMTDRPSSGDGARAVVAHQSIAEAVAPQAAVAPGPASIAPAAAPQAAPVAASEAPVKSAAEEKKSTRIALERGKLKEAIAAGERSVALDPSDGETWLLLGAAYQDSGNGKDARRCFGECTKQGKRGPINECRMMLR